VDEKSFIHGTLSIFVFQEEGFRDVVGDSTDDYMAVDELDFSLDEPAVSNLDEEYQIDYEEKIVSKLAKELYNCSQNSDSFLNTHGSNRKHIFTSPHNEIFNNKLIYENYVSDSWEGSKGGDAELMSVATNNNEESLQNQPLLSFFLADVDQKSSKIGEVVIDIPQSTI
jgi:hypothetical protein